MSNTRTEQESIGLRVVGQFVREKWRCRFQELDARNDDGIDGIIFLAKSGEASGETIFVQVKCGPSYKVRNKDQTDNFNVRLGIDYIETHRPRWNRYPGPVILIYVDSSTDKILPFAWWADLKSQASYNLYSKSYIIIDSFNRFGEHSKGHFKNLCTHHLDYSLETIELTTEDFNYIRIKDNLKKSAREKYKAISKRIHTNPTLGEVIVNRVGWKHITRPDRKILHVNQSFELIGALEKIISSTHRYEFVKQLDTYEKTSNKVIVDNICLRAKIIFPHRYQGVVVVMLKRKRLFNENGKANTSKIWFYSIFESRRGKKIF